MHPWRDALLQPFSAQLDDIELKLTDKKAGGRIPFSMLTGNAQNCTACSITIGGTFCSASERERERKEEKRREGSLK
jgi:anaerobic ribonucleoside-triphosphate reductase